MRLPFRKSGWVDADIIHLRNGGTILADAWEERGENLIIHQGSGTLVVPRTDVLRIETEPGPDSRPPVKVQLEFSREPTAPKVRRSLKDLTEDEIQTRIDALKKRFTGRIRHIVSQADPSARTFPVEIELDNSIGELRAGMFARATLVSGPKALGVLVPRDAIVQRQGPR